MRPGHNVLTHRSAAIQSRGPRSGGMNTRAAILALLMCALAPAPALAQDSLGAGWRQQQNEAQQGVREGRFIPLPQVIQAIRLEQGPGGRTVYRVRWASDDGRRIDFIVDAQSGQILSGG
jgi:hypothetical protein